MGARTITSMQSKTRTITKPDGSKWKQNYNYNPKTGQETPYGEPWQVESSTEEQLDLKVEETRRKSKIPARKQTITTFTAKQVADSPVVLANDIYKFTHDKDGNEIELRESDLNALKEKAKGYGYKIVEREETETKTLLGIDRLWPDKVSTRYDLVKIEDEESETTEELEDPLGIR